MKTIPKYYVIVNIILSMKILADLKPEEIPIFILNFLMLTIFICYVL